MPHPSLFSTSLHYRFSRSHIKWTISLVIIHLPFTRSTGHILNNGNLGSFWPLALYFKCLIPSLAWLDQIDQTMFRPSTGRRGEHTSSDFETSSSSQCFTWTSPRSLPLEVPSLKTAIKTPLETLNTLQPCLVPTLISPPDSSPGFIYAKEDWGVISCCFGKLSIILPFGWKLLPFGWKREIGNNTQPNWVDLGQNLRNRVNVKSFWIYKLNIESKKVHFQWSFPWKPNSWPISWSTFAKGFLLCLWYKMGTPATSTWLGFIYCGFLQVKAGGLLGTNIHQNI